MLIKTYLNPPNGNALIDALLHDLNMSSDRELGASMNIWPGAFKRIRSTEIPLDDELVAAIKKVSGWNHPQIKRLYYGKYRIS